jgi:AcrR family transcriptional regulator
VRRSAVEARQTRAAIIEQGMRLASVEGLDGVTIGRLATHLGMSKSGVLGHFGTKEALQVAVVEAAADQFDREVPGRARSTGPGLPRLAALCAAWITYHEDPSLPGGCLFTAAATEFDDRPGPVRDTIAALAGVWLRDLRQHVRLAIGAGDLPAEPDADQIVFELTGHILALHNALRLTRDPAAPDRARRAVARLLGRQLTSATVA